MRGILLTLLFLPLVPTGLRAEARREDFFARKVRPILATYCFKCHGPDAQTRKARLRLDIREEALKPARSRLRAIVPGNVKESELLTRVFSKDESEVMPPPATKSHLNDEQKQILQQWIKTGAEYTTHWSFVAPRRPPLPAISANNWPRNPIDHLVLARLDREKLQVSPQASREALIRRVTFDLIGLPPTIAEIDAFLHDTRVDAYDRLVDRLLASPAYGERWARRWLDLARYADTNGYEKDRPRSIWPYRNWVINALNADMPFDRFTIEQLAGDMLPGAGAAQKIATGFHRNTMLNEEGGIDPLEFRFHAMTDRVSTTATVWLGLTMGCAQCHSHKYDPLSQKEYYQFMAFLNNAEEPELEIRDPEITAQRKRILDQIADLEANLAKEFPVAQDKKDTRPLDVQRKEAVEKRFAKWQIEQRGRVSTWTVLQPLKAKGSLPLLSIQSDQSILVSGDQSKRDIYDVEYANTLPEITAIRLEALTHDDLPRKGPGRGYYEGPIGDFFLSEFSTQADGNKVAIKEASQSYANGGNVAARAIDGDQQSGWSVGNQPGRDHHAVFRFAEPIKGAKALQIRMLFEKYYAAGLGRFRISVTNDSKATATDFPMAFESALLKEDGKRTPVERELLFRQFLRTTPELQKVRTKIKALRDRLPQYPTTLVMKERPRENPRSTAMHHRGEYLQPKDKVQPSTPEVLHALPKGVPGNRLAFAKWLVSRNNPLVARVTVNRHWSVFFGQGIVSTPGDFGLQGSLPTHPDLLDWLAVEFMESGWSMKRLHRLIVTSATYQQTSAVTPTIAEKDPENRLFSRGPRVRLEAEMIRDLVLRSSGLLTMKLGGPSVFPPQPPEVTTEGTYGRLQWKVSEGPDRYRRGLYTFMKRTAPFALFSTFDAPSGEVCIAKREVSNSPLQALTMLNDQTILEGSQVLGRQLASEKGLMQHKLIRVFRTIMTRRPSPEEILLLTKFYESQKTRFANKSLDAQTIAGPGNDNLIERAAWTALVRVLFNLDETIVKG